jgi:hypothetical protein
MYMQKKEKKSLRFSAIITGASQGGSPEPMYMHPSRLRMLLDIHTMYQTFGF